MTAGFHQQIFHRGGQTRRDGVETEFPHGVQQRSDAPQINVFLRQHFLKNGAFITRVQHFSAADKVDLNFLPSVRIRDQFD